MSNLRETDRNENLYCNVTLWYLVILNFTCSAISSVDRAIISLLLLFLVHLFFKIWATNCASLVAVGLHLPTFSDHLKCLYHMVTPFKNT